MNTLYKKHLEAIEFNSHDDCGKCGEENISTTNKSDAAKAAEQITLDMMGKFAEWMNREGWISCEADGGFCFWWKDGKRKATAHLINDFLKQENS
jgi:formate dehydrogenase assembly factor FdhD